LLLLSLKRGCSNVEAQKRGQRLHLLEHLLEAIRAETDAVVLRKLLYALGCLLRGNVDSAVAFVTAHRGWIVLYELLQRWPEQPRVITLATDLSYTLGEGSADSSVASAALEARSVGWCNAALTNAREAGVLGNSARQSQALELLDSLVRVCWDVYEAYMVRGGGAEKLVFSEDSGSLLERVRSRMVECSASKGCASRSSP
jgi:hypothetical protein